MNPKVLVGEDKSPRAAIAIGIDTCAEESKGHNRPPNGNEYRRIKQPTGTHWKAKWASLRTAVETG